jgi:hypothetical protein
MVPDGPLAGEIVTAGSDAFTETCVGIAAGTGEGVAVGTSMGCCVAVACGTSTSWVEAGTQPPITSTLRMSANIKADSLLFISNLPYLVSKYLGLAVPVQDEHEIRKVPICC